MCNFYIMYYIEGNEALKENTCASSGYPYFRWNEYFRGDEDIPREASVVPGTNTILEESQNRLFYGDYISKDEGPQVPGDDEEEDEEDEGDEDGNEMHRMKNSYPSQLYLDNIDEKDGYPVNEYPDKMEDSYIDKEKMADLLKELSASY